MFRKVISLAMVLLLTVSFGTSTFASMERDREEALEQIEKTNIDIDKEISEAVVKADEMTGKFVRDLRIIEEGKEVVKLKEKKAKLEAELLGAGAEHAIKIRAELNKIDFALVEETGEINAKIADINADIAELNASLEFGKDPQKITEKITALENKLDQRSVLYSERTRKYTEELDKLILELYNETLKMSQETIKKAAEKGVQAECSWTLVKLGNQWVWIDPIRVQY
ncbi:hypothetical protein CVD28_26575 [Bacillus sp. M6-12]|uniref:hypothetical protein n=1 Tax=Bacillus sp. M6-12 TaxID=2054166 RepID=UPI000C75FBD0|nr:hypothetical protein [Bacillus sp. M6-12]PLS14742.1 hypothetical protein CVD28_26575 [Bacillus sp. M6-12]